MPEPSVNSLPRKKTLAKILESLSPTNTSAHPTKNTPVNYNQNLTISLLPSTPDVITRSSRQRKYPSKFSDNAHSSFLAFIYTFLPQQYQLFQQFLQTDF